MLMKNPIDEEKANGLCRSDVPVKTCSYLTMGTQGWECAKGMPTERMINQRREAGTMKAKGDNCQGPQHGYAPIGQVIATVRDALTTIASLEALMTLRGFDGEFLQNRAQRVEALGRAICAQFGVPYGDPQTLSRIPQSSPLGGDALRRHEDFKAWFESL